MPRGKLDLPPRPIEKSRWINPLKQPRKVKLGGSYTVGTGRRKTKSKNKTTKWFTPSGRTIEWDKNWTESERRRGLRREIRRRGNNRKAALSVFRALIQISNLTQDKETKRKMKSDSMWISWKYLKRNSIFN